VLYLTRRFDEARLYFDGVLESEPNNRSALYMLGLLHIQAGSYIKAVEFLKRLYALKPDLAAAPLGYAYARLGSNTDAWRMLSVLEDIGKHKYVPGVEKAIIYMGLGDNDKALRLFMQACQERVQSVPFIKIDPLFDSLRSDPRYNNLAECAKISSEHLPASTTSLR
jgi:tetratricopeptide (TPR) repeat protein